MAIRLGIVQRATATHVVVKIPTKGGTQQYSCEIWRGFGGAPTVTGTAGGHTHPIVPTPALDVGDEVLVADVADGRMAAIAWR